MMMGDIAGIPNIDESLLAQDLDLSFEEMEQKLDRLLSE